MVGLCWLLLEESRLRWPNLFLSLLLMSLLFSSMAYTGNKREEQLADSVRLALSRAINDAPTPKLTFFRYRLAYPVSVLAW